MTPSLTRPGMLLGLGTLLVSLLAPSWTAAQPSTPPVRIGYLSGGSATSDRAWRQAFMDGLRELGWIPGQNAIVTVTTPAAQAAKRTTTTVPIVVAAAGDVLGSGLVPSIAHPGGNITGLSFLGTELVLKQMDLLLEILPKAARLAFMGDPRVPPETAMFSALEAAGRSRNVSVRFLEERDTADYAPAFARITREGMAGLIVAANVGNQEHRSVIIELAARHRIQGSPPR